MNQYNLNLDLDKGPLRALGSDYGGVTLRQGDRQGCVITAHLYDHGVRFTTAGLTASFVMELPDHAHYYCATCSYSAGTVSVTVDERYAASVPGKTVGYFELRQGDTVIASTRSFAVTILGDAREGHTAGESYDSRIAELIAELTAALAAATEATAAAQEATRRADEAAARMGYNAYLDFHEVEGKRYLSVVVPQE